MDRHAAGRIGKGEIHQDLHLVVVELASIALVGAPAGIDRELRVVGPGRPLRDHERFAGGREDAAEQLVGRLEGRVVMISIDGHDIAVLAGLLPDAGVACLVLGVIQIVRRGPECPTGAEYQVVRVVSAHGR